MYIHNYSNIYRNDMSWNLKIPPNYPVLVSFSTDPTISSIFFWFSPAALNWTKLICFPWETKQIVEVIQSLIILEAVLLLLLCVSKILHPNCSAYISWNNGRILMFKVSKWPYRSSPHDKIICRWRHNPPGGENLN